MSDPTTYEEDDGLDWLREIRRKLSAECNHDPHLFGEKMRELEKRYAHRIISSEELDALKQRLKAKRAASAPTSST